MKLFLLAVLLGVLALSTLTAWAQTRPVVDIPARPGVMQRMLLLWPENPKAVVVLFAGGHGGLQISPDGRLGWGEGNFLVRTRQVFASLGLMVAVVDAPSDRQTPPYLAGFRQRREHVEDIKAVIAWARQQANVPVWLVGTSSGTQSVAFIATQLAPADGGPDGIVLTSTIVTGGPGNRPVPAMPLGTIMVPVLVVHHKLDGCPSSRFSEIPGLMEKLTAVPRKTLLAFEGGTTRGDPCEPWSYHGYLGIEREVVASIAEWITRK